MPPGRARSVRRPGPLAALAVLVAVLGAGTLLVQQGAVLVHQCVVGDGLAGRLGLSLALLRAGGECPAGTLAIGGEGTRVMGVVVVVALPVLLAHLVAAGLGVGLGSRLRAVAAAAVSVLGSIAPRLPVRVEVHLRAAHPVLWARSTRRGASSVLVSPWRRGPPVLLPA
ncbi:hypothetical protein [Actinotalea sp. K2]|uniref:hypothetical protein n=1 Tax=Actinotalea sp. K2 TaxID=2939438 RepID=UPI002017ED80|nr:hypothetical protein [Actinotalea sp. K2]MCL3861502.1 hypothetical protein [Actinotalea sp. K2]